MTGRWRELPRLPLNERHFERWSRAQSRWPDDALRDPFWHAGSHPDCVERVWTTLNCALPEGCRFVVRQRPVLAHPLTSFVFALPFGTEYAFWLPPAAVRAAHAAGLGSTHEWSGGAGTDISAELGQGWVFGAWLDAELGWVNASYQAAARVEGRTNTGRRPRRTASYHDRRP
jgi:hypothetical protein